MMPKNHTPKNFHVDFQDIPAWLPDAQARILILAPHPDDETLAAGGLIASSLATHPAAQIRVVVATNGDASLLTTLGAKMNIWDRRNFQRMAVRRQQESISALIFLGLDIRQILFWGFPDRGLDSLWQGYWKADRLYRSATTGYEQSEQAVNSPRLPYTGASLLSLFQKELTEFQPTTVIFPHPEDAHPDHSALSRFALLSAGIYANKSQNQAPEYLAYRMWQDGKLWLKAAGNIPAESHQLWQRLSLSPEIHKKKVLALQCYASQKFAAGQPLRDAAQRSHEIFASLQPYAVSSQAIH